MRAPGDAELTPHSEVRISKKEHFILRGSATLWMDKSRFQNFAHVPYVPTYCRAVVISEVKQHLTNTLKLDCSD